MKLTCLTFWNSFHNEEEHGDGVGDDASNIIIINNNNNKVNKRLQYQFTAQNKLLENIHRCNLASR